MREISWMLDRLRRLGSAVSGIGQLIFDLREPLARVGGVVVMLLGLATMDLFGDLGTVGPPLWFRP